MIEKYDIVIYPRHLFVAMERDKEEVKEKFLNEDEEPFSLEDLSTDTTDAFTYKLVLEKGTLDYGVLVMLTKTATVDIYVHEAVHCATAVFKQIGIMLDEDNDEPLAYFIQFLFRCINKAAAKLKE